MMPWGGRFSAPPAPDMLAFTSSVTVDRRLWAEDIAGSRAHVGALERSGLVTPEEGTTLRGGLDQVEAELAGGAFDFQPTDEDIHMAVERRLTELVGAVGGKLHTGRSRNDQVATDLLLYLRRRLREVSAAVASLADTLHRRAVEAGDAVMPGYTHLQRAQPVLLAHHLAAHAWALLRDVARLSGAAEAADDQCPLGAGALSGTGLLLDPAATARDLGFRRSFRNSIDAVASRDLAVEAVAACAIAMATMSRLAEDVILWSTTEFGFAELPDSWSTGSSMMPQKRNPDVAELVRGRAGRVSGRLGGLLATVKALPLSYDRDLQEDKEPLFDALDTTSTSAAAMAGLMAEIVFLTDRMAAAGGGDALATELADRLVRAGAPFRQAHREVGELVARLHADGRALHDARPEDLEPFGGVVTVDDAVAARHHTGGTAPSAVAAQLDELHHAIAAALARVSPSSTNVAGPLIAAPDPELDVRPFEESDYLPLTTEVPEWYSQPMQAILLRRFVLHFGSTSFVAWRRGERVGFVIGWLPPDRPDEVFVHSVTLAPGERGRGTGRVLYARLAEAGRRAGRRRMVATIRPHNEGSLAFHRAMGFSFRTAGAEPDARGVPVIPDWDGPGEDRVVAEAALEELRI